MGSGKWGIGGGKWVWEIKRLDHASSLSDCPIKRMSSFELPQPSIKKFTTVAIKFPCVGLA